MAKINANKLGLTIGIFVAALHALWAVLVAVGQDQVQAYLDWIFPLHFIGNVFQIMTFNLVSALILVVMAFVGGYICGWVLAWLWNMVDKK